ncbi:hypothetical protein NKH77_47340 [Streptomyces sp. M19]
MLVLATVGVGSAVIAGSSLSFLGLGPQPPAPEWGRCSPRAGTCWTSPGRPRSSRAAITVTVLAVNVVGRDLQRRFEGRRPGVRH